VLIANSALSRTNKIKRVQRHVYSRPSFSMETVVETDQRVN